VFECPTTSAVHEEIRASAIQFVRKLSGTTKPSKANEAAFNQAVDRIVATTKVLLDSLVTTAPPKDRQAEAEKARAKATARFGGNSRNSAAQ
jgi:hypothetical protein